MVNMTIEELVKGYKNQEYSPVEITNKHLDQCRIYNAEYNAFITICEESALSEAKRIEATMMNNRGEHGILQAVPISYKDSIDTKGMRTTNGSLIHKNRIATEDANVVKVLKENGALNLGKNNMYEYGFGITSDNPFYGPVKNPWNTDYMAGGSSGGSAAAVAANLSMASIGTDTAGSIRVPAACCGVIGLKPTYNLIPMYGVMPLSWTLDHVGPITKTVSDLNIVMEALTKRPYKKSGKEDIKGLKIGVPDQHFNEGINEEVREIYQKALEDFERLGAELVAINMPFATESIDIATTIATAEVGYTHNELIKTSLDLYGEGAKETFDKSRSISSFEYIEALKKREIMSHKVSELYESIDVIATPTLPVPTTKLGESEVDFGHSKEKVGDCMIRYTCLFDITGHPALSLPCGITNDSMPVSLQLISNHYQEDVLMNAAHMYEKYYLNDFYQLRNSLTSH
ncbi:aspartyl-tRNA(Asn)/glutamyl-tRNA(Gln) amidotransferase subunit A [Halobacillus karajensis]|nr:aspartyl-tRNA(Asn)/glutamyl-tRNA(Gln) amidotransferase subunit A [Halobacillus karajensis]